MTILTPHPFGGPVTSAAFNDRLTQVAAAIDAVLAAGVVETSTSLDSQALSGQAVLDVVDETGFLVGDSVFVGAPGSGLQESGTLASLAPLTLDANLANTHAAGSPVSRSPAELVLARSIHATLGERLDAINRGRSYPLGAAADGVTNDHGALQAAADLAGADGIFAAPPGDYYIGSSTLEIHGACELAGVVIHYDGTGVALRVRNGAGATRIDRKRLVLPAVTKDSPDAVLGRSPALIGIQVWNTQTCDIYVPLVSNFGLGLYLTGDGAGNVYNSYFLGHLNNNLRAIEIVPGATGGWVNENTFLGGRCSINSGEGAAITDSRFIRLVASSNDPNNNRFVGVSLEGNGPTFTVECFGSYNQWIGCRWEGTPSIKFDGADAHSNVIAYGYGATGIVFTEANGALKNHVFNRARIQVEGEGGDGVFVGANATSNNNPVFATLPAGDGIGDDATTRYGWRAGQSRMEVKALADTGPRFRLTHASGDMDWGPGDGTFDVLLRRLGANVLQLNDDLRVAGLIANKTKAGAFVDGDALGGAVDGMIGIDTTNDRIYFRQGGVWSYVAKTAGFQIPADEHDCPSCGKRMRKGQRVIGRVESTMADGALHGLWEHLECPE
jgi:hypothetical protein